MAAVPLALALAAAGCGGGSSSGGTVSGTLNKQELISRADAICANAAAAVKGAGSPTDAASYIRYATTAQRTSQTAVRELETLKPPPELAADYAEMVAILNKGTTLLGETVVAARKRDARQLLSAGTALKAGSARATAIARRDGFTACAQ